MNEWTYEYFEEVLQKARETRPDYKDALQERGRKSEAIRDLLLADNEQGGEVQAYVDSIYHAAMLESELLYIQGYHDCVDILRFLRIVS